MEHTIERARNEKSLNVVVIGAGGLGKTIISVLQATGYNPIGILDDNEAIWGNEVLGVPVIGNINKAKEFSDCGFLLGISDNKKRDVLAEHYKELNWINLISDHAYVNPTVRMGKGSVVFAGAVIGADVTIGKHVIASANITIGHDAIIQDFAHIAPGVQIAGAASIGRCSMLGMSSVVCPKVVLGDNVVLGAGAVAVKNIPSQSKAFGVPAVVKD